MIKVDYIRDGLTEELHEGVWALAKPIQDFHPDNSETPYYIRSCIKPLQATLIIDNGLDFTPEEIAFCCGSNAGEDCHVKIAQKLLKKIKLSDTCLKCGIHAPLSKSMQNRMIVRGDDPTVLHNNCSGKHIAFLAICEKNGWDIDDYDSPTHPLQIAIKDKVNGMCGVTKDYPISTDGCGVPIISMPLHNLIQGYMKLLEYPDILKAIKTYPYIYGGEDRTDTEIITKTDNLIAKVGAGGLCVVLNVQEQNAFAVKINDASYEARKYAVFEIINRLGWGEIRYDNRIMTISKKVVGEAVVSI